MGTAGDDMIVKFLAKRAAWLCLAGLLCASAPAHAGDAPAATDDEAWYLIGVAPADTQLIIAPGEIKGGTFAAGDDTAANPADGFILAKAGKAGRFAITGVQFIPASHAANFGDLLVNKFKADWDIKDRRVVTPCGDDTTIAFEALAHKVLYIGTVLYSTSYGRFHPQFLVSTDLDKARAFLQAKYPDLAGRVEQGSYELRALDRVCPK
jgi:hypothetical protein